MTNSGRTLTLKSGDGAAIDCYHVEAQGKRRGGLIVVMEVFGVTADIRRVADGYAQDGFEVLAPAFFDRLEKGFEADHSEAGIQRSIAKAQANGMDNPRRDVEMSRDYLKPRGPVFMVGYCYGGAVCLASSFLVSGLAAVSSYYGSLANFYEGQKPRCPIICHFGKNDPYIPLDAVERLGKLHPDIPIHLYDAGHGFNSSNRADYHPPSAKLARERTLALFAANGAG